MPYGPTSSVAEVLDSPAAQAVLARLVPEVLATPSLEDLRGMPLSAIITPPTVFVGAGITGATDPGRVHQLWAELAETDVAAPEPATPPDPTYEDDSVPVASAAVSHPSAVNQWGMCEIRIDGPSHGNPYTDVELSAEFTGNTSSVRVGGFYDGDGQYVIRFMPDTPGRWTFRTLSTARSIDGLEGAIEVRKPSDDAHGPVRVADTFHFAYADGTRFVPWGTTAYAWTHQNDELEERTVRTLGRSPFNKVRMCLFPKAFIFNDNEPERYPFPGSITDGWDTTRFEPEYFRHLEKRIGQLQELGIEVDLILLHPYDRWGFSRLNPVADRRLLTYVVRRLAAYRNVWWSMANEYDMVPKPLGVWADLAAVVKDNDHVNHLLSIHNWVTYYDNSEPWITHCSLQAISSDTPAQVAELRRRWGKPVIIDECGYEGDLSEPWGNLTAEEMVRRSWETVTHGAYFTHGETYLNDENEIFWSKGGDLVGRSPARIAFLADLVAGSPSGVLDPISNGLVNWGVGFGGVVDEYYLMYLGSSQPRYRRIRLAEGQAYTIDIIDTWNMTTERLPGSYSGDFVIDLPGRPYIAVRLIRTSSGD